MLLTLSGVDAQEDTSPVDVLSLCGDAALKLTSVESTLPDDQVAALDELLKEFLIPPAAVSFLSPSPPAPGAALLVETPEGRYFRAIGVADVKTCVPLDPLSHFGIGSNTKMMTAAVIYQLQEEGKLSTNDLISKYLPDEIALFPRAKAATIDMLLTHTAGLPDYLNSKNPVSIGAHDEDPTSGELGMAFTPQELIANAAEVENDDDQPQFSAGEPGNWQYSNTGYIMLGLIIEQVTGQTYDEAITERIIKPLGLKNTFPLEGKVQPDDGLPSQYVKSPFTYESSGWDGSQAWSAGNVISTSEDMAVFLRALFSGDLYQQPDTLKAMLTRAAPGYAQETDDFYYMHGSYYQAGFYGHGGQTLGMESDVGYNPELGITLVLWTNSAYNAAGAGVFHVGHALGLTPTFDEVVCQFPAIAKFSPPQCQPAS